MSVMACGTSGALLLLLCCLACTQAYLPHLPPLPARGGSSFLLRPSTASTLPPLSQHRPLFPLMPASSAPGSSQRSVLRMGDGNSAAAGLTLGRVAHKGVTMGHRRISLHSTQSGSEEGGGEEEEAVVSKNTRNDMHIERKVFHVLGGFFFAAARLHCSRIFFAQTIGALGLAVFLVELGRLRSKRLNVIVCKVLGLVMRAHERQQFSGMSYYLLGVTSTVLLFHPTIAVIGILALAIGDPAASFVGVATRKFLPDGGLAARVVTMRLLHGKSLAGTLGFFFCTSALSYFVLAAAGATLTAPLALALILAPALMGAIVELVVPSPNLVLPFKSFPLGLDDNFMLPVMSSLGAHIAWKLLGSPLLPVLRPFVYWG